MADKEKVVEETAKKVGDAAEKTGEAADAVKEAGKTWPDVADKALEGLKEGLGDVANVVHNIGQELSESAPHVWHGLVEYHRWMAIGELFNSLLWVIGAVVLIIYGKRNFNNARAEGSKIIEETHRSAWPEELQFKFVSGIVMMMFGGLINIIIIQGLPEELGDVVVPERRAAIEVIQVIRSGGDKLPER